MRHLEPIILGGKLVQLEPLRPEQARELFKVSQDPDTWTYMPMPPPNLSLEAMQSWINLALSNQQAGDAVPFVIRDQKRGCLVGSTSYLNIERKNSGLEIGATWLQASSRRTGINTECKYLLLQHAFEILGAIRVQLKTDSRNLRSQQAIERIGAQKEGVLRNHMILPDGSYRHSVYFSIIASEWPQARADLLTMLARQT